MALLACAGGHDGDVVGDGALYCQVPEIELRSPAGETGVSESRSAAGCQEFSISADDIADVQQGWGCKRLLQRPDINGGK